MLDTISSVLFASFLKEKQELLEDVDQHLHQGTSKEQEMQLPAKTKCREQVTIEMRLPVHYCRYSNKCF